jgi:glucose-6-phosphate 1-epimerase
MGKAHQAQCTRETIHGQAGWKLTLDQGDTLMVTEQGAHVVSWKSQGREQLFLSPLNIWDGMRAIRGGIPVCFPQFNQRGTLPKHGFARNMVWQFGQARVTEQGISLDFTLTHSPASQKIWNCAFEARIAIALSPGSLKVTLSLSNLGAKALEFSGALHTYLAVSGISTATLSGLRGQAEWDAVRDAHTQASETLTFHGEFDRVYAATLHPLVLRDSTRVLEISQSPSWGQTVVWNPGSTLCSRMDDMPKNGYDQMLCVEAAQVFSPIAVPAQGQWHGWQNFTLQ